MREAGQEVAAYRREQAQLRAYTRIAPGGDMDVCVPAKDGRVDTELWQLHAELVKHAQAQRTELMNTMFSAISKFIKP